MATNLMKYASIGIATLSGLYATFILLLTTSSFQRHVIYLHKIQMTWFKDSDYPEQFEFLHNQATPVFIKTTEGSSLYAWRVLPLETYRRNEEALIQEAPGLVTDFTSPLDILLLTNLSSASGQHPRSIDLFPPNARTNKKCRKWKEQTGIRYASSPEKEKAGFR